MKHLLVPLLVAAIGVGSAVAAGMLWSTRREWWPRRPAKKPARPVVGVPLGPQ